MTIHRCLALFYPIKIDAWLNLPVVTSQATKTGLGKPLGIKNGSVKTKVE